MVKNAILFAKGKRSLIYVRKQKNKSIAFKVVKDLKRTKNVLKNEYNFLKLLNKYKIGPKVISKTNSYVSYEFVDGLPIINWIEISEKNDIIKVLKKILIQCFTLDKLNINKKELHRPVKHIIIKNNNPVMIDFERCYLSKKPKNLTQFCQFLINKNVDKILKDKNININKRTLIRKLKIYKNNINKRTFDKIVSLFF